MSMFAIVVPHLVTERQVRRHFLRPVYACYSWCIGVGRVKAASALKDL